jgi:putative ABC transport system permease protein
MTLLIGAGLITQTFWRLVSVDAGFRSEGTLTAGIRLPQAEYPDVTTVTGFHDALLEKVRALPQVSSAALTRFLPLSDGPWTFAFDCEELPLVPERERLAYAYVPVSTEYFRTAGISLLRGRSFTAADNVDTPKVLVINEAMKQQFWPDEDPLGVRIRFDVDTSADPWREIVGVVNDVRHDGLHLDARPAFYGPRQQGFDFLLDRMRLVVRTDSEPLQLAQSVRDIVRGIDPNLAVFDIRTMDQLLTGSVAQPRFSMWLFLCFAFVAAFLALIGIYGVISHTVRHRLPELGLRVALGARGRSVGLLVLAQGMVIAAQGIGLGLLLALIATHMLRGLLFEISATDPLTYIVLTALLAGASAAACYVPARKAAKADPMVVMRGET